MDPLDKLLDWIAVDSTTGREGDFADLVGRELGALGLEVELLEAAPGRPNVLARAGEPRVLLCTHLDTVPPFLGPRRAAGAVHGRGACDAKGVLLAMFEAVRALLAEGRDGVGFLLTVGEEVDGLGARHAAAELAAGRLLDGRAPAATVVGEPTGNRFASGHKGIVKARLCAHGVLGHSATPKGPSAVHELVHTLERLLGADWGSHPELGPGSLNVGRIQGGRAPNVVADLAEAELLVRAVEPFEEVVARLRAALGPDQELELDSGYGPVTFSVPGGESAFPVPFGTDAPYLTGFGKRFLIGPGRIELAHSEAEHLTATDFTRGIADYHRLLTTLLATHPA